ncbi:MAG: hypothetical protein M3N51_02035 [Actinomycetota bacterium]|nr:hypothetical protein [Actinomycetota bacterium]
MTPVLGFLYPGYAAEDDYPALAARLDPPVEAVVVHTSVGEDAHRADALRDLGSDERLREGARRLTHLRPAAVVWACTSGAFVFGWEGAERQVEVLRERLGVPCSSTSFSFIAAVRALEVRRVAVGATYPAPIADLFGDFLAAGGIEVTHVASSGIVTAAEVGALGGDEVLRLALQNDHREAEAILLPDTALHTVRWLTELEEAAGKPVITANQATVWHALQLAKRGRAQTGLGLLFTRTLEPSDAAVMRT